MGDVVALPMLRPNDGGKARILRRCGNYRTRSQAEPIVDMADDLKMDHADPAYEAPPTDCA